LLINQRTIYGAATTNMYLHIKSTLIDAELIKVYIKTLKDFEEYMNAKNSDECLDYKSVKKYTDSDLRSMINKDFNVERLFELSVEERNKTIKYIYDNKNISIRQLGRVLGIGKTIIERAIKQ